MSDRMREAMIDKDGAVWEKIGGAWSLYRQAARMVPEGWKLVPSRCPLCEYQCGHRIGCDNNPVDIAMKAAPAPKEGD